MKNTIKLLLATVSVALLTACGGGGGGGTATPAASALTFDLSTALRAAIISGQNSNLSITSSNGCVGTGSFTASGATTGATFEGRSALSATSMLNINYTNCSPATISSTSTTLYDTNYVPLGTTGDRDLVYTGTFNSPTNVKVGDVGIISNFSSFTNATQDGTGQLSYVVEADAVDSALITVVTKSYTIGNSLELTQLTKYRINSYNQFTLVSFTTQYANGLNIVMTRT